MSLFGKKDKPLSTNFQPEMPPSLSDVELAEASRLMDRWDSSLGNNDAVWNCLEMIARRGGFTGIEGTLREVVAGKDAGDVTQRPWRWWHEAARLAQAAGNDVLPGRIFLFTCLFTTQMVTTMNAATQADVGLGPPAEDIYKSIATIAVGSLAHLSPALVITNSATDQVDAATALMLAEQVSGVSAAQLGRGTRAPSSNAELLENVANANTSDLPRENHR